MQVQEIRTANIFNFDGSTTDDDGEVLLGYYFQIVDGNENPVSHLTGPYSSSCEVELACQKAYDTNDY